MEKIIDMNSSHLVTELFLAGPTSLKYSTINPPVLIEYLVLITNADTKDKQKKVEKSKDSRALRFHGYLRFHGFKTFICYFLFLTIDNKHLNRRKIQKF